jgi:ubiquinone/menaquinone biosynthesis C-methylase UbiE
MDGAQSAPIDWRDAKRFDREYQAGSSQTIRRIWQMAYGDDYPAEAEPHSFVTRTDLGKMVHLLALNSGSTLVDLGCGRGGPGLWLARTTGASLIGIDLSAHAIALANERISEFGLVGRARFLQGDLCATGLTDQSCDAAISIDVVMFVPDLAAVFREAVRILRPGAPFIFTAFERQGMERYRTPLQDNGFEIEAYEEKPDWRRRLLIAYEQAVAEQDALFAEMGEGAFTLIAEANASLADGLGNTRQVFVVGRKR